MNSNSPSALRTTIGLMVVMARSAIARHARLFFGAILAILAITSAHQAAAQTTVALPAARDSELYERGTSLNFGACNEMWAYSDKKKNRRDRSVVAFNLTGLPANITITAATLRLTAVKSEGGSKNVSAHPLTQAWTEGSGSCSGASGNVTWNNRTTNTAWSNAGGTFGAAVATRSVGGNGVYNWNIGAALAQQWYNNPAGNHGLLIKVSSENTGSRIGNAYATKESGTAANRPQLIITYTFNCTTTLGGATSVCVGSTANVTATPSTGGSWSSLNPGIATVTAAGVVTGVSPGTATLRFTQGSCIYNRSITVNAVPTLGGATSVCAGSTANVTPSTGGTWSSGNTNIASVTNGGVVTGIAGGTVSLTFTSSAGCVSSVNFTVNPRPTLGGATSVCVGSSANVTPSTGGTWISSSPSIATVTNGGVVTGQSSGSVTLTYTNSTTGCSETRNITVNALPIVGGASNVAVGATANVTPNTGGAWISNTPLIATVTPNGEVTGVAVGSANLTFTSNSGCSTSRTITVFEVGGIGGDTSVCTGFTATVTPTGGTWISSDPTIASVTNAGVVTGVSPGTVTLEYTEFGVTQSTSFTVNPLPTLGGAVSVCAGSVTNVTPSSGGIWVSSNTSVAAVNNAGQVVGISPGDVTLTFTSIDGCAASKSFSVLPRSVLSGSSTVKVGSTTTQEPVSGGTWSSSDETVATISNDGVATGVSTGAVVLTFTSSGNGCSSSKILTVIPDDFYRNVSIVTPGNEEDPIPENNTDPEEVDPQSWTALIISVTNDVTGNGLGDAPLGGIQIIVTNGEGDVVFNGTTGPDGLISIDNLTPGTYTVTQSVPGGTFTLYDNPVVVPISLGETSNADFVNSSNGSISGTIFLGFDDELMPDVLVTLLDEFGNPVLDDNDVPVTTITDENGFYQFFNIPPGTYQVQQTVPPGFTAIDDVDGGNLTINGDVIPIVILPASNITFMDFINAEPPRIVGNILIDTTIDGGGDTPQVGVTVNLLNAAGIPVLDAFNDPITTITDADGYFEFLNLPVGSYRVSQIVPSGFTAIDDSDGGDLTVVGDVTLIVLALGDVGIANFTNQPQTDMQVVKSISNSAPAIGTNVTFVITVTNNGPNPVTAAKVEEFGTGLTYVSHSTATGTFELEAGAPTDSLLGTWDVGALAVNQSATLNIIATVTGSPDTIFNNRVVTSSELGDPDLTNNEFDVPFDPPTGTIRGRVRIDTTGDDEGNVPQPGVIVTLLDVAGVPVLDGNGVPITSVTDALGNFEFGNLPPGTYQVSQAVPSGFIAVNDFDGGDFTVIGDVTPIVLASGQNLANRNFVNSQLGSIAGNVSRDATGDGSGDTPMPSLVLALRDTSGNLISDSNGDPITVNTDEFGNYIFTGVPAGQYQVALVVPFGLIAIDDVDGDDLSINGDAIPIVVIPAQNVTDQNFVLSGFADLGVTKTVDNPTPNVGSNVTFTITAINNGPLDATGVSVDEQLPSGFEFVSASANTGSYDEIDGIWNIGNLANQADATLQIVAKVLPTGIYNNIVVIDGDQPDPIPENNTDNEEPVPVNLSITGNLFNDLNGLDDNTVNGVGTDGGGVHVNLVDASNNTVVASIPVNPDGTYTIGFDDGIEIDKDYFLILTAEEVVVGTELLASFLNLPWISTGENLGAGPGDDGTVDGILAVNTSSGPITEANFGIKEIPDLSPVITVLPSIMTGPTQFNVLIRVRELNTVDSDGLITLRLPKDARWTFNGPYNPSLTSLSEQPLNNSDWTYSETPNFHVFQSTVVIPGFDNSWIGFAASWNSGQTEGVFTMTSQIDSFSGGEIRNNNNSDAESIQYFIQ